MVDREETKEAAPKEKIEDLGNKIVRDIKGGNTPRFTTLARTRSNIVYDQKNGYLKLGKAKEERNFLNVAQSKRFMQTIAIASKCHKFVKENLHTTIRGLFYQLKFSLGEDVDENIFNEQAESNPLIEDLEVGLGLSREALNLNANRKGVLAGNMKIRDRFGDELIQIDCSKQGRSGWAIPSDVDNDIEFIDIKAKYVLCLPPFEKITVIKNGQLKITKIEDVVDSENDGLEVISFDEEHKICKNKIESFHKRDSLPGEKLVKITSKSGSVIHVSEDHKIPVMRSGKMDIVRAKDLRLDDFLIEAKRIKCLKENSTKLDLIEMFSNSEHGNQVMVSGATRLLDNPKEVAVKLKLSVFKRFGRKEYTYPYTYLVDGWRERDSIPLRYYIRLETDRSLRNGLKVFFRGAKRKNLVPAIIDIDEDFCKLLGYYLAEGHIYRNSVGFSFNIKEMAYQNEIRDIVKRIFGTDLSAYSHGNETQMFIQNKAIAHLFEAMNIGRYSHTKRVPDFIYNLPRNCIRVLIKGYLNGDGYKNTFDTVSEELQLGINILFRIIEVPTYKAVRNNDRGFPEYKKLPIYHTAFIERYFEPGINADTPHYLWERYPLPLVSEERKNPIFEPYFANHYKTITRARLEHSYNKDVTSWLNADIHPVMVRKIEFLDYSGPLYDIVSVVPTHVFMHASGIFSHNCVEKDALWQRLNEDGFWKKENCILITPQGQAARGTRRLIRKLADAGLPVYVFTDSDAWGWYIYWTIKTGSINLAYIGDTVATPEARFIGVTMSDLDKYSFLNKLTINANEVDIKRAQEMLNYEWIKKNKEWVIELERMIKSKKKLEQDALQGPRLTFVGEYIKEKIKNKEFLP